MHVVKREKGNARRREEVWQGDYYLGGIGLEVKVWVRIKLYYLFTR